MGMFSFIKEAGKIIWNRRSKGDRSRRKSQPNTCECGRG
jgi:hypothetical protein